MLKTYALLIAVLYSIALTTVSLIQIKGIPDVGISFGDKIFHFLAYSVLIYAWFNTLFFKFKFKKTSAILYAAIFSIVFGIIIEVLQGSVTSYRSSDLYDAIANTLGVLLTALVLLINSKTHIKNS